MTCKIKEKKLARATVNILILKLVLLLNIKCSLINNFILILYIRFNFLNVYILIIFNLIMIKLIIGSLKISTRESAMSSLISMVCTSRIFH